MHIRFCLPLLALGLAACGGEAEEPKSDEEVIAEMNELAKPEPGLYRTTSEMVSMNIPGMPPEQAKMIEQQRNSGPETSERCLTEEEASKGFEDMVRGMGEADETAKCDFTKFDVDGSDLDAKMTCSGPVGSGAEITMAGTVESDKTDLTMDMKVDAGPLGEMNMQMKVNSERVGPCPG